MTEYLGIAVCFVLAGGIVGAMVLLSSTLGRKHPTPEKLAPFECGQEPFSLPTGRLPIKFYLVAILFILFHVELVLDGLMKLQDKIQGERSTGERPAPEVRPDFLGA